mmetsp:Transcript_3685/g.5447  ORF Transcript_3685/g.5447 Transcript_3685/m.5447 type:complete len:304 (-) Transcript_3685:46-957(-)
MKQENNKSIKTKNKIYDYNGLHFEVPLLSKDNPLIIQANETQIPKKTQEEWFHRLKTTNSAMLDTVNTPFSYASFDSTSHAPFLVSPTIKNKKTFSTPSSSLLRVLDCPIKFPGSCEYRIPHELACRIEEPLRLILSFYHLVLNPSHAIDFFAYLTFDEGPVPSNVPPRHGGIHVDGFQGSRVSPKHPLNHTFILYDALPTSFYPHVSFDTSSLNPSKDHFFKEFERRHASSATPLFFPSYSLLLLNPYCWHASTPSSSSIPHRVFMRVSFSTRQFDRLGNTHNPLFDYSWSMVPRSCQLSLS